MLKFLRKHDRSAIFLNENDRGESKLIGVCEIDRYDQGTNGQKLILEMYDSIDSTVELLFDGVVNNDESMYLNSIKMINDDDPNMKHSHTFDNIVSYLKSLLQKSIRLQDVDTSVAVAKELCKLNPLQFLRRLPIIIIEDASLDIDISGVMWLMLAVMHHKHQLSIDDVRWLMIVVHRIASISYQDPVKYDSLNEKIDPFDFYSFVNESPIQDQSIKSAIACISLRVRYGGMKGDIKMMKKSTKTWINRLTQNDHSNNWNNFLKINHRFQIVPKDLDLIRYDPTKHNKIEAADFHPFPWMATQMSINLGVRIKDLKKAIWFGNSCHNNRPLLLPMNDDSKGIKFNLNHSIFDYEPQKIIHLFPPDDASIKLWNESIKDSFHDKAKEILYSWSKHYSFFCQKLYHYRKDEHVYKDLCETLLMLKTDRPTFNCIGLDDLPQILNLIKQIESMENKDLSIFCSCLLDYQVSRQPLNQKWIRIIEELKSINFQNLPKYIKDDWPHDSFDVFIALNRFNLTHSNPIVKTESNAIKDLMLRTILFQSRWSMYDSSATKFNDLSPLSRWWFSEIILLASFYASKLDNDDPPPESFMSMASQMPHILSIVQQHQQPLENNPRYATETEIAAFEAELDFPPSDDDEDDGLWKLIELRP